MSLLYRLVRALLPELFGSVFEGWGSGTRVRREAFPFGLEGEDLLHSLEKPFLGARFNSEMAIGPLERRLLPDRFERVGRD